MFNKEESIYRKPFVSHNNYNQSKVSELLSKSNNMDSQELKQFSNGI